MNAVLFQSSSSDEVRIELHRLAEDLLGAMSADLRDGLSGMDTAAAYVTHFRALTRLVLEQLRGHLDEPPVALEAAETVLVARFDPLAAVPVLRWPAGWDPADSVAVELTDRVRAVVGLPPPDPPREGWVGLESLPLGDVVYMASLDAAGLADASRGLALAATTPGRFFERVREALDKVNEVPLERVRRLFGLSKTELGTLFGVSRQAVDGWIESERVPGDRQEKLAALAALADLLERKLKPDRIPGVMRRNADRYDGRSMLDLIRDDRHGEVLASVRDSFAWHQPA